jgi:hypothetical protein
MNKREFEKYVLSHLDSIKCVCCNIHESYNIDNNPCCWVDVFICGHEYTTVFCSYDFDLESKEVVKLQKSWERKLKTWLNPRWGIELRVSREGV